jgi:hypothetical protein
MFFPERITGLEATDRVLEVGPGSTPFARADVFLERAFFDEGDARKQRGGGDANIEPRKLIYYDGGRFPFNDREFDYVICSHVVEHVEDVPFLVAELSRVAPRGYLEYPTVYYEYLYNFSVHLNLVKRRNGTLYYLPKRETSFDDFLPVQKLFYRSLEMGHSQLVDAFKDLMFEGFQWEAPIEVTKASSLLDVIEDQPVIPDARKEKQSAPGFAARLKRALSVRR